MFKNRKKQEETEVKTTFVTSVVEKQNENTVQPVQEEEKPMEIQHDELSETSILTEDVVIDGDVRCECSLTVLGTINGNVQCGRDLFIKGQIRGNVTARNLELHNGSIEGSVECTDSLTMDRNCQIHGDVKASECLTDGRIYGSLTIAESLHVQKNAWIEGDITAKQFSVLQGAHLDSKVVMIDQEIAVIPDEAQTEQIPAEDIEEAAED